MYDQLGSWVIWGAVILFCLCTAVRGLMGKASISAASEDADYDAHRTPGMGEPATVTPNDWHPSADWWTNTTAEPIYQQLCADTAAEAARYIDTERWLENGGGAA